MNYRQTLIFLVSAGLVLMLIGMMISLAPNYYLSSMSDSDALAASTSRLIGSIDLLSDIRGMGGMLLFLGGFILLSAFRPPHRETALLIATLIYGAFVVLRSLGLVLDGVPSNGILLAYSIELLFFLWGLSRLNTLRGVDRSPSCQPEDSECCSAQ